VLLGALAFINRRRTKPQSEAMPDSAPEHYAAPEGALESVSAGPTRHVAAAADEMGILDEATKYLALGRDAQAEEVLKEALRNQPTQPAVLLKLLEVYAGRKDKRAFQSSAQELLASTGGSGDLWMQAARMGHGIDPENPLYAAAATIAGTASDLDFDLDVVGPKGVTETDITIDASQAMGPMDKTQVMNEEELRRAVDQSETHEPLATASSFTEGPLSTTDFNIDGDGADAADQTMAVDVTQMDSGALDINFDLPPEALATSLGNASPSEVNIDLEKPQATPTSSDILDFDLSGISLDLDAASTTGLQTAPAAPMKSDHWFDVQTKFDLAKAYQEMGDKESAREILKEVVAEGDVQQQAEAKALLDVLA
jgi:pilus assembly protein FimV